MFKGKAIYNPSGKAGEYSYWACNFYVGCSNGCTYCYLKKGRGAKILGGNEPKLKKCFKSEEHALKVFETELQKNIDELKNHGLFFSFSTDPCLPETIGLTLEATRICQRNDVPVKILTKGTDFTNDVKYGFGFMPKRNLIAFGFTLTGHDELEPNASQHHRRIKAMIRSKNLGFRTFASIEPIIDFKSSYAMFLETLGYCDIYKIGLESGKHYSKTAAKFFILDIISMAQSYNVKVYFKDSLLKCAGYKRDALNSDCCVNRDYNLFK